MTAADPEQHKAGVAGVFDRAAPSYGQGVPFFTVPGRRLVEIAEVRAGMAVVDVGAGRGAVTLPAAEAVGPDGRVVAGDLAPAMVELLRADVERAGLSNVEVSVMDAEDPRLPPSSADRVLGSFVIFFLPDPVLALRRYADILRPGGRVGLTIFPGIDPRWKFWGDLLDEARPPHQRGGPAQDGPVSSPQNLAATLAGLGYRDVTQVEETYEVVFPDTDRWWDWVWSQGQRAVLEQLSADDLAVLRDRGVAGAARLARPDGSIVLEQRVTFTTATPG